jgi:hypothetical protein
VTATIALSREKFCPVADFREENSRLALESRTDRENRWLIVSDAPANRGLNEGGSRWPRDRRWVYAPRDSINVFACALGIEQGQIRTLHQRVRVHRYAEAVHSEGGL